MDVASWTPDYLGNLLVTLADRCGTQLQLYPDELGECVWLCGEPVHCQRYRKSPGAVELEYVWTTADQDGILREVLPGTVIR